MKNNRLDVQKTNSTLNKKESSLNFKQALSKKFSKKSNILSKQEKDKPLKANKKTNPRKSKEIVKNQIKPFLTKNEIKINCKQKTSEKIQNLLKHINNNNSQTNNYNSKQKKHFKNKSTTNLCNPGTSSSIKNSTKIKTDILDNDKSPKLNDFILDNNEINQDFNKENNNNILKTNLAFLIAKNQNYDDDSVFLNINESYLDYINNMQHMEIKRRNIKKDNILEEFSLKNSNNDNSNNINDTNSLVNSIININKYLTNEVNHKAVNNTTIIDNKKKKSKPHKVYENQLSKTPLSKEANKPKKESKNSNNENDKNINNINNNIETINCAKKNDNNNNSNIKNNSNYQREIINKVLRSKYSCTGQKISKNYLIKKRKSLNLEDLYEENNQYNIISYNTHSPKTTVNNKIIKNFQFSPNICNFNKTIFNINSDLTDKIIYNYPQDRIKVSKAKKYLNDNETKNNNKNKKLANKQQLKEIKEDQFDKSTKSNNTNSLSSNKTNSNKTNAGGKNNNNNYSKVNEFNIINEKVNEHENENVNNLITNDNNIDNNNEKNYNIFDDEFYSNTFEFRNDEQIDENTDIHNHSQLNKYINYIDKFSKKKIFNKKFSHNSSCQFIYPSISNYKKYNTLLIKEKNSKININNSNIDYYNNEYLNTQEDENNNSKIQEIKIKLKNPTNLNSSVSVDGKRCIKTKNIKHNINVLNVKNSTINICKNKYNIIAPKSEEIFENYNNINNSTSNYIYKNKSKNRSISSVVRNSNKSYIYSTKSPSYRHYIYKFNRENNDEFNCLNISNDKIMNQKVYTKQIFNNNIVNYNNSKSSKIKNSFMKLEQKDDRNNKIQNGKNIQYLLKTESSKLNHSNKFNNKNNLNINMLSSMNNFYTPEMEYNNIDSIDNIYNNSKYEKINNIFESNKFCTTNKFFHHSNSNDTTNYAPAPKIYVKPSKCTFKNNNNQNFKNKFSPEPVSCSDYPSSNNFIYSSKGNKSPAITSYRNNYDEFKKNDNYFEDIEFINNTNTNLKINENLILFDMHKTRTRAYIKKNKDINYNKKINNKLLIKKKISNNNNHKFTKYYNFYINKTLIIKRPFYCSKYIKKPKNLPICKRSFMTKIIYKYFKKLRNEICYIDKIIIKNKNNDINSENKEINNINIDANVIKANILDFSLEHNKDSIDIYKNKYYFHHDKDYQESVGDINLSFSIDDVNTFKCKENTIEAVFNELNNVNNDSEVKVTFGQDNINDNNTTTNCNNFEISTEGRIINDSFNESKNNKIPKIPKVSRTYKRDEIIQNIDKKCERISSVIIYDNEEENEDIKINLDINRDNIFDNEDKEENYENESYRNDGCLLLDVKPNEEGNLQLKIDKVNIDINDNIDLNSDKLYMKNNKKIISSKDVINFTEKLENIFDKKKNNSIDNKNNDSGDINIYYSNLNIFENDGNKLSHLLSDDLVNEIDPKSRTYVPIRHKSNKYLDILSNNDLTPLNKLEKRINFEKNDFIKENSKNNSINETESDNENNVTFSQNKIYNNQLIIQEKEKLINIKKEIIYILNIITINNFTNIIEILSNILLNENNNINKINNMNGHKNIFLKKQNIFVDIIINKSILDMKYSFLYAILCKNLYHILLKKENNLYRGKIEDNIFNIINNSIRNKFNGLIEKVNNNDIELKCHLIGIINFIIDLIYIQIILVDIGFDYLDILYNKYINNSNNDIKSILLEGILFFLDKFGKIIYYKKDRKNIENINNFINGKIKPIIEDKNKNILNINKYLINRIINIKENDLKITIYEEFILNKYKNIIKNISDEKNDNTEKNPEDKYDNINNINDIGYYTNDIDYATIIIIKNNLINYNSENNNITLDQYTNLYLKYKIDIYAIIQCYIEICIDYVDNISLINNCNNYINNIIENYSIKDNKNEKDENKIVDLISNIDYIILDNKYMYQIMGYLLYALINYEIYKIEDLDKFIGREEQTLINIAKVIKYIIIYCNKDFVGDDYKTKILEEFKKTELFKSNQKIFDIYVINDDYLL